MSTIDRQNVALAVLLVLLMLVLYVSLQYALLRAKYNDVYSWYGTITNKFPNVAVNIGPTRTVMGYEYPAVSSVLLSRPVPQPAAEFIMRLIRVKKIPATYLFNGVGASATDLSKFISPVKWEAKAAKAKWEQPDNQLWVSGQIPFNAPIVVFYTNADQGQEQSTDFSLLILWLYGYEEYVRQRFTSGATSVLDEWNFMFATTSGPPHGDGERGCDVASAVSSVASSGVGAAGVGAMVGAAVGGIGAPVGAAIGFLVGSGIGLLSKKECL